MILTLYFLGVVIVLGILTGTRRNWYEPKDKGFNIFFILISSLLSWFFVGWFLGAVSKDDLDDL